MNKRITKRDADGQAMMDCQKCEADWTGKHGKPMADCTALYCRNRLKDRLAEYEDTGLTPEQVEELAHDTTGPLHRKIGEWIEAEAAGRLVVLPCKVGDTLWAADTTPVIPLRVMAVAFFLEGKDGGDYERLSNVGKTVFLTREEAEKAL